jgi:SAM-dependent methyltransferase
MDHCLAGIVAPYATLALLYDALLGDRFFPILRRAFEWLVQRYNIRFTSVADVACGTGTFARYLRDRGVPIVYGVDSSPEMLRIAIRKNSGNGVRFLLQDFATLQLPQPVDLITSSFDSLNYLLNAADLLGALGSFHTNLKPGGHTIFDMITDLPSWQHPGPRIERVAGPGVTVVRLTRWDPRHSFQTALVSISRDGRPHQEIHVQRGYPVAMVFRLLARAKFITLGIHDFDTLQRVPPRTSRAVYVARVRADIGDIVEKKTLQK